jgi:hypothetical protein
MNEFNRAYFFFRKEGRWDDGAKQKKDEYEEEIP